MVVKKTKGQSASQTSSPGSSQNASQGVSQTASWCNLAIVSGSFIKHEAKIRAGTNEAQEVLWSDVYPLLYESYTQSKDKAIIPADYARKALQKHAKNQEFKKFEFRVERGGKGGSDKTFVNFEELAKLYGRQAESVPSGSADDELMGDANARLEDARPVTNPKGAASKATSGGKGTSISELAGRQEDDADEPEAASLPTSKGHANPGSTCHIAVALSAMYAMDVTFTQLTKGGCGKAVVQELQRVAEVAVERVVPKELMKVLQDVLVEQKLCGAGHQDANLTFEALAAELRCFLPLAWRYSPGAGQRGHVLLDANLHEFAEGGFVAYDRGAVAIHCQEGGSLQALLQDAFTEQVNDEFKIRRGEHVRRFDSGVRELVLRGEADSCPTSLPVLVNRYTRDEETGLLRVMRTPLHGMLDPITLSFTSASGQRLQVERRVRCFCVHTALLHQSSECDADTLDDAEISSGHWQHFEIRSGQWWCVDDHSVARAGSQKVVKAAAVASMIVLEDHQEIWLPSSSLSPSTKPSASPAPHVPTGFSRLWRHTLLSMAGPVLAPSVCQIDENDPLWHWREGVRISPGLSSPGRMDGLRPWLQQLSDFLTDFWVDELHSPQSRDLLRLAAAAPLHKGSALSDRMIHRARLTFSALGGTGQVFNARVKYARHACGRAFARDGGQGFAGWFRRLLAEAVVEPIAGARMQELDGQAMHCYIMLNILHFLGLDSKNFKAAAEQADEVREEIGTLLRPDCADQDLVKKAGKEAINAIVYGASLRKFTPESGQVPPLLAGLHQEMRDAQTSLNNLGILQVWRGIANIARERAREARKKAKDYVAPVAADPAQEDDNVEDATDLTAIAYIAGTLEGAVCLVAAQQVAADTAGAMRLWAWLHDGAPYIVFPGVDASKICALAEAAVQKHLGLRVRFRMKNMTPTIADRAKLESFLSTVFRWPDNASPALLTEALKAEFLLWSLVQRRGLIESWDDPEAEIWTLWLPEDGVRVYLKTPTGNAAMHGELQRSNLKMSLTAAKSVVEALPGVVHWLRLLGMWPARQVDISLAAKTSSKGKLLFTNGILDMATGTLEPFTPDVVSVIRVHRAYNPSSTAEVSHILKGCMSDEVAAAFRYAAARALGGHTEDRQLYLLVSASGRGTQGKSSALHALGRSFGPYVNTFTANSLQYNARSAADPAKEMLWMKNMQHTRLAWSSELRGGGMLDGETIKMISGGDADGIVIREHQKEQRSIFCQSTNVLCMNEMPRTYGDVQDRVVAFPVRNIFVWKPTKDHHVKRQPNDAVGSAVASEDVQNAIVAQILRAYQQGRTQEVEKGLAEARSFTKQGILDIAGFELEEFVSPEWGPVKLEVLLANIRRAHPGVGLSLLIAKLEGAGYHVDERGQVSSSLSTPVSTPVSTMAEDLTDAGDAAQAPADAAHMPDSGDDISWPEECAGSAARPEKKLRSLTVAAGVPGMPFALLLRPDHPQSDAMVP